MTILPSFIHHGLRAVAGCMRSTKYSPHPNKALGKVGGEQAQGTGGVEERPWAWALEAMAAWGS